MLCTPEIHPINSGDNPVTLIKSEERKKLVKVMVYEKG